MPPAPRTAAAPLLCAAALLALAAPPARAADDAPWTAAPVASSGTGPAEDVRRTFYLEGAPGAVLEDKVAVTNPGDTPRTVRLRGTGTGPGTGAWIRLADDRVTVPARTRAEVPFTVTVPEGARPGDHPAAIEVSGGGREARVGLRLRVSGPTLSALTVERVRVVDGRRISYDLVNRGNTTLTPKLAVHAEGVFGEVLDRAPRTLPVELPPGRRITRTEPWPEAPALDRVELRLTVTAGGGARDVGTARVRLVPWGAVAGVGGGLVAVVGAALWVVRGRGRGRRRDRELELGRAGEQRADTADELTGAVA